jgi:hypothetical protein
MLKNLFIKENTKGKEVRRMKKLIVFLCATLLVFSIAGQAGASPKYVYDGGLGTWQDADKTNFNTSGGPDGLMCWAASASNALAWAGWPGLQSDGTTLISSADNIFSYFVDSWPNNTGNVMYGYDWWFDNKHSDPNDTPTQNAGFYASYSLTPPPFPGIYGGYFGNNPPNEGNISTYIDDDRAIQISIELTAFGGYSHSVTVWGMDPDLDILYFTDSDDGLEQLRTLNYSTSGGFLWLDDYTNAYTTAEDAKITQAVRLNRNTDGLTPSLFPVPEPATLILLGSGLACVAFARKRMKSS